MMVQPSGSQHLPEKIVLPVRITATRSIKTTMTSPTHANQLADETSPYLQQHASNPVHWMPWSEEALTLACEADKPILLSIGYAACHWCHVMAQESFADPDTAQIMNDLFVCIKVDREERPDIDKIYQNAHYKLTERGGGWPLTLFLNPHDQAPFFAGTYIPREARSDMPAFTDLMRRAAQFYQQHYDELISQNAHLINALQSDERAQSVNTSVLNPAILDAAYQQLSDHFEPEWGGWGDAPKFPHPTNIERCLRHAARSGDKQALHMAVFTLTHMACGGIYDQVGGGFCRYSVDREWNIPHFEKMLYDNAQLLVQLVNAARATRKPLFNRIIIETANWMIREMQSPAGGYFSTLDADSDGEEGKYYLWTPAQIDHALVAEAAQIISLRFGLDQAPNFDDKSWHLRVNNDIQAIAEATDLSPRRVIITLTGALQRLFEARQQRTPPKRDEKILTSWNGLAIKGMAAAAQYLNRPQYLTSAERALDFVRSSLWVNDRLLATARDDKAQLKAYLDDYVFLVDAILELLQARWRSEDMAFAIELTNAALAHFEDPIAGSFFFTADDHEQLVVRTRPFADDALPSGNAIAAQVLLKLGQILGEQRYLEAAQRTLQVAWPQVGQMPMAYNALMTALEYYFYPPTTVVLRGETDTMRAWQQRLNEGFNPQRTVLAIPAEVSELPGRLATCQPIENETVAYICHGLSCAAPETNLERVLQLISDQ